MAATLALAVHAGVASADWSARTPTVPLAGPAFGGDGVEWVESRGGARVLVRFAGVNRAPRDVQELRARRGEVVWDASFAGSALGAVLQERVAAPWPPEGGLGDGEYVTQSLVGPPDAPLHAVGPRCGLVQWREPDVDAAGSLVTYPGADCGQSPLGFDGTVQDTRTMPPTTVTLPYGVREERVAGHYVAYLDGATGDIVVYDLRARQVALRVAYQALRRQGVYGTENLALRSDGAVALTLMIRRATPLGYGFGIKWASPADPAIHSVGPLSNYAAARWAGDGLLVLRSPTYSFGFETDGALAIVGLDGTVRHVVARGVNDLFENPQFAFSDGRVLYVTRACNAAVIHVASASAPTRTYRAPTRCPLRLTAPLRATRGGAAVVHASCDGLLGACSVETARLITADPRHPHRQVTIASFDIGNQTVRDLDGSVTVPLSGLGHRLLRRHHRIRVHLTVQLQDGVGDQNENTGQPLTQTHTATAWLRGPG